MKKFTAHVSNGKSFDITARGFADAAAAIITDPTRYPLPRRAVIGIEGPNGSAKFYLKREDVKQNLFPISARAAAFEASMP